MSDDFAPMSHNEVRDLERQWKAAHTGPATFVPGPKKGGNPVGVWPWLVSFVAFGAIVLLTKHEELKLRDAITVCEAEIADLKRARRERPNELGRLLEQRVDRLENRVFRPRFTKHAAGCQSCRGDALSPEGGPSALCEEGFKLWQDDMREDK